MRRKTKVFARRPVVRRLLHHQPRELISLKRHRQMQTLQGSQETDGHRQANQALTRTTLEGCLYIARGVGGIVTDCVDLVLVVGDRKGWAGTSATGSRYLSVVSQATQQEEPRRARELDACDTTI